MASKHPQQTGLFIIKLNYFCYGLQQMKPTQLMVLMRIMPWRRNEVTVWTVNTHGQCAQAELSCHPSVRLEEVG